MLKVFVNKQSNYPVSSPMLKKRLREFFKKNGIVSDAVVSVAIVGESRMKSLAKEYLNEKDVVHNVLSFTENEVQGTFVNPTDKIIRLGEIIVCYSKAIEEAKKENLLIQEKIGQLVEHGALHLIGIHHD